MTVDARIPQLREDYSGEEEQPKGLFDFAERFWGRFKGGNNDLVPESDDESGSKPEDDSPRNQEQGEPKPGEQPKPGESSEQPKAGQPFKAFSTQAEYEEEVRRAAQAEVDRRETVRKQREGLEATKRKAKENPVEFADDAIKSMENDEMFATHMANLTPLFDGVTLDPLLAELKPEKAREIVEKGISGFQGRMSAVKAAIAEIRADAEAAAESKVTEKLKKDPAFRKQVLSAARIAEREPVRTPAPVNAKSKPAADMSSMIRQSWRGSRAALESDLEEEE